MGAAASGTRIPARVSGFQHPFLIRRYVPSPIFFSLLFRCRCLGQIKRVPWRMYPLQDVYEESFVKAVLALTHCSSTPVPLEPRTLDLCSAPHNTCNYQERDEKQGRGRYRRKKKGPENERPTSRNPDERDPFLRFQPASERGAQDVAKCHESRQILERPSCIL